MLLRSAPVVLGLGLILLAQGCAQPSARTTLPLPTPTTIALRVPTSTAPAAAAPEPTATPAARLPLRIGAQLEPPEPEAGQEFMLRLRIVNGGDRPARGVYIDTSGPWDRFSIVAITPGATLVRDAAGWHIISALEVASGASATIEVRARADEPTEEEVTFAVREAEPGDLANL